MFYEINFLLSLGGTLFIEGIIAIFFLNFFFFYQKKKIKTWQIIFTEIISSGLTLPYLWFIFPVFIRERLLFLLIGEVWVVITEMMIYHHLLNIRLIDSFYISIIKNSFSFLVSYFLR